MLEVAGLTKAYRNVRVVDKVSFTVRRGAVTGYLGPNGSGKSTTVKMLTGLLQPSAGRITFDGRDIRDDLIAWKRRLGYVPEEAHVYQHLSGLEYLQLVGRLRSLPEKTVNRKAGDLLQLFSLHPHRFSAISSYSKGMKQRILIAAALLHNPDVLILDEPLSGLDTVSTLLLKNLMAELARQGRVILYISHVLEVVEKICGRVIVIYKGRITADDSVERLRDLMQLPSLEEIFAQLVQQEDMGAVARDVVDVMQASA